MTSNLKELKKKRASYKTKLTQFEKYLNVLYTCEKPSSIQLNELSIRLSKVEEWYNEYDSIQMNVESLPEISDGDRQSEYDDREIFESQYFAAVAKAQGLIGGPASAGRGNASSVTGSVLTTGGPSLNIKLPTIHLPTFSGRYEDWLEFHDTYLSLVHSNSNIPKISKFHYLRAALTGRAANVITALDFSENNYDTAWSLLCDRYQNTKLLINNHIQSLFDTEQITKESASALRNLIDIINKNLNALKTLNINTQNWDILIIHMMSSKLDSITSRNWKEHINIHKDLPTLNDFIEFLKNRAELLETIDHTHLKRRHSEPAHIKPRAFVANPTQTKQQLNKAHSYSCPFCKQAHPIYVCSKFKSLSITARINNIKRLKLCMNCLRQGHDVKSCRLGPCRICGKQHNTLLHTDEQTAQQEAVAASPQDQNQCIVLASQNDCTSSGSSGSQDSLQQNNIALSSTNTSSILLSTALISVLDSEGNKQTVRALLDNGSTSNFVSERLCRNLKIPVKNTSITVEGLSRKSLRLNKRCQLTIVSRTESYESDINCFIVPQITQLLPTTRFEISHLNIPKDIQLADPSFYIPSEIDILLNADIFWNILGTQRINLGKGKPILSETRLGWLVSGAIHGQNKHTVHCHFSNDIHLQNQLDKFFELESVPSPRTLTKEENECEQYFIQTTTRQEDGRFVVKIPLKQSPDTLGDSYEQAACRFQSLERKFKREPKFKEMYSAFIQEYIDLGHMTLNTDTTQTDKHSYFLPHHGVIKESSSTTKLRVVFDASAPTTTQVSFNDIQRVGPIVQDSLLDILIRFRQHKYIVTADCEKMYRCVNVSPEQRCLQQVLWRFDHTHKLDTFKLNTLTYGTASAAYLATRCLVQLGKECPDQVVGDIIIHSAYIDDYIFGEDTEAGLLSSCRGVINELKKGQFNLRKWRSNSEYILENIHYNNNDSDLHKLVRDDNAKTLGLRWSSKADTLHFTTLANPPCDKLCKRNVLSTIGRIFDPLGLINPCLLPAKLILQELWASKITWDESLPPKILEKWMQFLSSLTQLKDINIPRRVLSDTPIRVEIHTFSDASLHAYSACVYLRCITMDNQIVVNLVLAKGKVTPLKQMSTPRLELCGALMAVRLAQTVKNALRLNIHNWRFWCDSTIVLGWIRTPKSNLKLFVCNRINEITDATNAEDWSYVPTNQNPADIGSRGCNATQLQGSNLWWKGPDFLTKSETLWPVQPNTTPPSHLPETKIQCSFTRDKLSFINNYSNFSKLQRLVAYLLRFQHNCRYPHKKYSGHLKVTELNAATLLLCKIIQLDTFSNEYSMLSKKNIIKRSSILNLNPFMSHEGLIRVGGRLSNSNCTYDTKHPILIHASHHITQLLFRHYHNILLHAGPQLMLATIRHKFWVIGGRSLARKVTHECHTCCRYAGKSIQPIMAALPKDRLYSEYVFMNTACDYAGPVLIANRKGRGCTLIKSYICIFVCLVVRAVHVELVSDLSTEAFMAALNRFVARRGRPVNMYSDNGTNFVGAYNELSKFLKHNSNDISKCAAEQAINFKFSPAYSPHFNGLAEGAVKSVKFHLKRVLSLAHLTYEEMNTVLIQIEGILNSRPLTPLSSDPNDLIPLTPFHFLIGRTLSMLPTAQIELEKETQICTIPRYQRARALAAHFWKRYTNEFLSELQTRAKWQRTNGELRVGDMVVVKDDRLPPNRWLLGRIIQLHPGSDGISRVADVRTASGVLRRAYNRLCLLPASQPLEQAVPTRGAC